MSLNDIKLEPRLLSDLYTNTLVESSTSNVPVTAEVTSPPTKEAPAKQDVNYLGRNEKGILILVSKADTVYLPDDELNFLTTILSACQLSLADVAIVNWKTAQMNLEQLQQQLGIRHILLFDVSPLEAGLPINFPHFQIQQFNNRTYLFSPALSDVEKEVTVKRQLWPSLKKMFSI
jgi:DNA polymerase III psi subunit